LAQRILTAKVAEDAKEAQKTLTAKGAKDAEEAQRTNKLLNFVKQGVSPKTPPVLATLFC
jgi:hypothetical protein